MAKEFLLILLSTVLVNTFVLVQFLGLCQFMGVSRKVETSTGLAFATTFVLTLSSVLSYIVDTYVLSPLGLNYLNTIAFRGTPIILIIARLMSLAFMSFTGLPCRILQHSWRHHP